MDNHFFRSALSGFNRQDVIDYIEKSQREASEQVQALELQINELKKNGEELCADLDSCVQERDLLRGQLEEMTQAYERAQAELTELRGKLSESESEAQSACDRQMALNDQLQEMQAEVAAARKEKESVAQLELEARKRAEDLLEETRAQAEDLLNQARSQAQALMTDANKQAETTVQAAYERAEEIRAAMEAQVSRTGEEADALISSVETITAHVAAELRKMDVAVAQLPINFDHLKDGLKDLREQAADRSALQG